VPPLAAIPLIVTRAEKKTQKRILISSWAGAIVSLMTVAVAVHLFVRPLDVVWINLLRRFGM
jgi:hypothetical protein